MGIGCRELYEDHIGTSYRYAQVHGGKIQLYDCFTTGIQAGFRDLESRGGARTGSRSYCDSEAQVSSQGVLKSEKLYSEDWSQGTCLFPPEGRPKALSTA